MVMVWETHVTRLQVADRTLSDLTLKGAAKYLSLTNEPALELLK